MWKWAALLVVILILLQVPKEPEDWVNFKTETERKGVCLNFTFVTDFLAGSLGHLIVRTHQTRAFRILQCDESVIGGIWLSDKESLFNGAQNFSLLLPSLCFFQKDFC